MATQLLEPGRIDIEAIKDQYPLAEVVAQHVRLRRKSGKLEGLCPFHQERTPSFKIYESDQRYHCYGCGAHGDLFDFLHHMEGLDLRAAAERLTGGHFPTYTPERIEELRAKRLLMEQEDAAKRERAILSARERWIGANPAVTSHPYLERKQIGAHGARLDGDRLLIPLMGEDGKIQTLQSIDTDGRKLFVSDAPVSGGLFVLGGKVATAGGPVIICEGFATAASIHQATGCVVVCAFNSGNLEKVAARLVAKYPAKAYLVAGDDDKGKDRNVGREAAIQAAAALDCRAVFPVFNESTGTDFNDMHHAFGLDAVRDLILNNILPNGDDAPEDFGDVFETLSLDQLEDLPPPTYLIDGVLPEHGLTFVYGEPGSFKSFVAVDMSLRIAFGMDWHGDAAKKVGVLYIAGEGRHGIGKRVKGWRREHGLEGVEAPFKLLPVAVHMLDRPSLDKLKRTIRAVRAEVDFQIGLVVIDTVSRAIAGHDENKQDTMSLFVDGCAEVHEFIGGAVIGVHHSGKDKERGMRGSSVLLGGCEASIRITKDEKIVKLDVEKQKDDEEAAPIYMTMKKVEWGNGLDKPVTTLVPAKAAKPTIDEKRLSRREADMVFDEVDAAWVQDDPWSAFPQAKRRGRYLIDLITSEFGVSKRHAEDLVTGWQSRGYMKSETAGAGRAAGLRVVKRLEQGS